MSRTMPFIVQAGAGLFLVALVAAQGCGGTASPNGSEVTLKTSQAVSGPDPVPCAAWSVAVAGNTGNVIVDSASLIDSYNSSLGPYGGTNVGDSAIVQAATSITDNGGVIKGSQRQGTPSGLAVVPVPAGAINLPLGSGSPGSLNINNAAGDITLAPGDYVVANVNVNSPGAIKISPAGQVRIWVTGNLNLGGTENLNGVPNNLAFLVTSSGFVNVNSGGALYGLIYAPTSVVNVNSTIFGSVVGSSVTLNSRAAVHFDQSSFVCTPASPPVTPTGTDALPAPPTAPGCYVGTLNGWVGVSCSDPATVLPGFQHFDVGHDGVTTVASPGPLVYGEVETTVESVQSESNGGTNNQWSVQNNTNQFPCNSNGSGVGCVVQFTASQNGTNGTGTVCITNADITSCPTPTNCNVTYNNTCVGVNGTNVTNNNIQFDVNTRTGALRAFDFANIAGYAFTSGTQAELAIVAQFSWVANNNPVPPSEIDVPNLIPGLFAVVAPDQYGLAGNWTDVTGGILGMDNGAEATLTNAEVLTRVAASDCPGDVSASGPTCSAPQLSSTNVLLQTSSDTVETNNLTLIQQPTLAFPNRNLVVTDILASDQVPSAGSNATCLSSEPNHLFIKDTNGDNGGIPSNSGGVTYWESPDIFILPSGSTAPGKNDTPADLELTAGNPYDVYLRVHNEYGCNAVTGPINVFIDAANPDIGFENWLPVTNGAGSGMYTTFGATGATLVQPFDAAIIGPFTFTPTDGGHKCLLAAIAADGETEPATSTTPGQPVLQTATYESNQIAQRNVQIGDSCTYNITNPNTTSANMLIGIAVTPATPVPSVGGSPSVTLTFADSTLTFFNAWNGQSGIQVQQSGGSTTVTLETSYIALNSVPLAGGTSPSVSINIEPGDDATPPSVDVSVLLTDPMTGDLLLANGGNCTGTGQQIIIP
jgi:hypothetical protein